MHSNHKNRPPSFSKNKTNQTETKQHNTTQNENA
jgi:hypothetical protein